MTIIWCMVPEISSATDKIFCHFGLTFALLPLYQPRKLKSWKNKKNLRDIIILHMSTINENHMMYDSWVMECNRQNFFWFWTIFCPFTFPFLTTYRMKILKKWKTNWRYHHFTQVHHKWQSYDIWFLRYEVHQTEFSCRFRPCFALLRPINLKNENCKKRKRRLEISSFYTSAPKIMIICYTVPEIWFVTDVIVIFHFGPFTLLTVQKMKLSWKWKNRLDILSFYRIVPKIMIICFTVPEIWCVTDVIVLFHFGLFFALLSP